MVGLVFGWISVIIDHRKGAAMKVLKTVLIIFGSFIGLVVIVFAVYLLLNRQGVIESYEMSNPEAKHRVLIASQGSSFKNALVDSINAYLKSRPIYFKVIDVTKLDSIQEEKWDAVVLIHTTEQWKLQPDVKAYLERVKDLNKIILVTTSGSGDWKTTDYDVDVITSASKSQELPILTHRIIDRIDSLLMKLE
jgi:hypothetical protein